MSGRAPGGASSAGARGAILLAVAVVLGIVLLQAFDTNVDLTDVPVNVGGTTVPPPTTVPANGGPVATTTSTVATRPPAEVKVLVANGTAVRGLGAKTSDALKVLGYNTLSPTDSTKALEVTAVQYDAGFESEANAIAATLGLPVAVVTPLNSPPVDDTRGANVILLLGADINKAATTTTSA